MKQSLLFILLAASTIAVAQPYPHYSPVNPNATPEAKLLLEQLYMCVDEGHILSGLHHNRLGMPAYRSDLDRIEEAVPGAEPVVWGGDLAWDANRVVELALEQHNSGHIIAITWHAARPMDKGRVDFRKQTQGKFCAAQWKQLLTEGSEMHTMWIAQVDSIAAYLKELQDHHVPVLWRPMHEMNGEWFWWGDRRGDYPFTTLWKMLYHRLTDYHHLNNLIWVWNPNNPRKHPVDDKMGYELYYPGDEYVDVLATDVYHREWMQDTHDPLITLGHGKLIALGETGELPTPEQLHSYNRYAWFMLWTTFTEDKYNTIPALRDIFADPQVVNMPFLRDLPAGTTIPQPGMRISATDSRISYIGRVSMKNPQAPCFTFPGVQIRARFSGSSLKMVAKPMSGYFMVSVDDSPAYKVGFNAPNDSVVTLAAALPKGEHKVAVMYVTEGYDRRAEFRGFILDEGADLLEPEALPERRIEFIGNSITCGYGVESMVASDPFSDETCNHYYTYAAQTARALQAQHLVVARSGIGVYRNYDGPRSGDSINMNTEYAHTLLYDPSEMWDFSRYTPQLVCINLGTNDTSTGGADPDLLRQGYSRLIQQVRAAYPEATILLLSGCMMHDEALAMAKTAMDQAVQEANLRGDKNIYRRDLTPQTGSLGYGASWHPSYWQQTRMAEQLTGYIREIMGWE